MKIFRSAKLSFIKSLADIIFKVSGVTFIVFFAIEYIEPGFVSNWFHPAWLLLIAIVSGIIVMVDRE